MADARKQFTFYSSYWEALKGLKPMQRAAAYDAIIQYALFEIMPDISDPVVSMAFTLIKPTLDRGRAKAMNGRRGGSASNTAASKTEAKRKQQASEKELELETEVELEKELELEVEVDITNTHNQESGSNKQDTTEAAGAVSLPPDVFERFWRSWGIISSTGEDEARSAWASCIRTQEDAERAIMRVGSYWCAINAGEARQVDAAVWLRKGAWK